LEISALIAVGFMLKDVDFDHVSTLLGATGPLLLLVLLPQFVALASETHGWRAALAAVGHRVSWLRLFDVRTATEAVGQSLPAGVVWCESLKPVLLKQHCGLPLPTGTSTAVHRKFLRLASHALYVLSVFGVSYWAATALAAHAGWRWLILFTGVALGVAATAFALIFSRGTVAARVHRLLMRVPLRSLRKSLFRRRRGFQEADAEVARLFELPKVKLIGPVTACLVAWWCETLESWLILRLLGVDIDLATVASIDVMVSLLRQVLFVLPAGVGAQELGYLSLLAAVGVADPMATGTAFSLIKRAKELVWAVIGFSLLAALRHPATAYREGGKRTGGAARRIAVEQPTLATS
jgi:uncharacterized protein (TIRG00374 family)